MQRRHSPVVQSGLTAAIALRSAPALRDLSTRLWSAALFGLGTSAFGRCFWSRPDQQHLFPLLALGAISAAFAFDRFGPPGRLVLVGIIAAAFVPVGPGRESGLPAASFWNGGWTRVRENAARPGARALCALAFRRGALGRGRVRVVSAGQWPRAGPRAVASHSARARRGAPATRSTSTCYLRACPTRSGTPTTRASRRLGADPALYHDPGPQSSAAQRPVVWQAEQFLRRARSRGSRGSMRVRPKPHFCRVIEQFGNSGAHPLHPAATSTCRARRGRGKPSEHPRDRLRIGLVLLLEDPGRKGLLRVPGQDWDRSVEDRRAGVGALVHEMDGASRLLSPASSARRCGWRPGKFGRSAGWMMRILPRKRADEVGRGRAHVAGGQTKSGLAA